MQQDLGLAAWPRGAAALGALLLLAAAASGCRGACDRLVSRYCDCDQKVVENQRGCRLAKDPSRRALAAAKAKKRGKKLEQICREKLDTFECPDRAVPEFYPGGLSFSE